MSESETPPEPPTPPQVDGFEPAEGNPVMMVSENGNSWIVWRWIPLPLAALLLLTSTAQAAELRHVRCLDGDTIVANIELGFDVVLAQQTIRIHAYDAWESSYRRQTVVFAKDELAKGALATAALEKLLGSASKVTAYEVGGRDPYGRQLLDVFADGKEVGAILRQQGHERK